MMTLSILFAGVADPMALLTGIQGQLRDAGADLNQTDMEANGVVADAAEAQRAHSIEKAIEAANKAISGLPRWAKRLIGAVLSAVGTVASVVTGGASVALTVIGVILIAGAEVVQTLADKGIIDAKVGSLIAGGLKIVASVIMSFGTSTGAAVAEATSTAAQTGAATGQAVATTANATTAVASTATQTASTASTIAGYMKDIADHIQWTVDTIQGSLEIHNSVRQNQADHHQLDADGHAVSAEDARDRVEVAMDGLKSVIETHGRAMRRIQSLIGLRNEMQTTSTTLLA